MKRNLLLIIIALFAFGVQMNAQTTLTLTTSGGLYENEKWVDITTGPDGTGTVLWAQGDGTYGNGAGFLANEPFTVIDGTTYYINCYDKYDDGWDGTIYEVKSPSGTVIVNNTGTSPDDGNDDDATSSWENMDIERESSESFSYTPPACENPASTVSNILDISADATWSAAAGAANYDWEVQPSGVAQGTAGAVASGNTASLMVGITGLTASTDYDFYIKSDCMGTWSSATAFSTVATPPANDECDNAISLTVNPDLACGAVTVGTNVAATASAQPDDVPGTPDNDVWYTFVATQAEHEVKLLNVTAVVGSSTDMVMGLYSGTCDVPTLVTSSDPNTMQASGLTIGDTYILRVFGYYSSTSSNFAQTTFDVCVGTPPPPPINDVCGGAISLDPVSNGTCTQMTVDLSVNYTDSGVHPTCDNTGVNIDAWFSFTTPSSGSVILNFTGTNGAVEGAIWDACGGNQIECYSESQFIDGLIISGLTVGNVYYLQTWNDDFTTGEFDLCLAIPASCLTPTSLTEANLTSTSVDLGWTANNMESGWNIEYGPVGFTPGDGTAVQVMGTTTNPHPLMGLTAATSYDWYVQADCGNMDFSAWSAKGSFTTLAPPPANDDCDNAIVLTVNSDLNCTTVTAGTTVGATASSQADDVSGTPNNDVWFTFVATSVSHGIELLNVMDAPGGPTSTDMGMGLYDGTGGCMGLVFVQTSDPNTMTATGLTVGTTYLLRVYGWSSSATATAQTTFDVCVKTPPPPPPPPVNDDCDNAIVLTVNSDLNCTTVTAGTTVGATASSQADDVTGTPNTDVWFSFVATATSHGIELLNVVNQGGGTSTSTDMGMGLYNGAMGCGNLVFASDSDPNSYTATGLTVGVTYYLRVYGWFSSIQNNTFDVCVKTPPPANDMCAGALEIAAPGEPGNLSGQMFAGSTDSGLGVTGCMATSPTGTDMWYKITTDANGGDLVIQVTPSAGSDVAIVLYSAACGSLVEEACSDGGMDGAMETLTFADPSFQDGHNSSSTRAGIEYTVRVIEKSSSTTPGGIFSVGVGGTALPVTFSAVQASIDGKSNLIQWSTSSEINNESMIVERSMDGSSSWTEVGRQAGHIYSVEIQNYEFLDEDPMTNSYYRINALDRDGRSSYSKTVYVNRTSKNTKKGLLNVFPIPAKERIVFRINTISQEDAIIKITDITGHQVMITNKSFAAGISNVELNIGELSSGVYFASIISDSIINTVRIVKQ